MNVDQEGDGFQSYVRLIVDPAFGEGGAPFTKVVPRTQIDPVGDQRHRQIGSQTGGAHLAGHPDSQQSLRLNRQYQQHHPDNQLQDAPPDSLDYLPGRHWIVSRISRGL